MEVILQRGAADAFTGGGVGGRLETNVSNQWSRNGLCRPNSFLVSETNSGSAC